MKEVQTGNNQSAKNRELLQEASSRTVLEAGEETTWENVIN